MNKIQFTKNQILFILGFMAFSVFASTINFTPFLAGDKLNFNLFDLYAPVAGGFFGAISGVVSVLVVGLVNLLFRQDFNLAAWLHVFPVLFGTWYFASSKKLVKIVIPALAIIGFLSSPIGREVWYYPMFWLIPIAMSFLKEKSVLARALGATFTAHAVGGVAWIHFFAPPAAVWVNLIPIVIIERTIFTLTTAAVYMLVQKAQAFIRTFAVIRHS